MAGGYVACMGGKKKGLQNFDEGNPKNEVTFTTEDTRQYNNTKLLIIIEQL
jgi:hypothetical protein